MYGLEATTNDTIKLDVSWADYGELTSSGFEYDETWTEGNVSNITTYYSKAGPKIISKFDASKYTKTKPDPTTRTWQIEFDNDGKSVEGKNKFYLYIPYRDFGDENGIDIKSK